MFLRNVTYTYHSLKVSGKCMYMSVCVCDFMCLVEVFGKCVRASADLPFFVSILQAQCIHGTDDGSQWLDGVAVNDRLVLLYIVARETILVDDPEDTQTH